MTPEEEVLEEFTKLSDKPENALISTDDLFWYLDQNIELGKQTTKQLTGKRQEQARTSTVVLAAARNGLVAALQHGNLPTQ